MVKWRSKIIVKSLNFTTQLLMMFEIIIILKFPFSLKYLLDEAILQEFLIEIPFTPKVSLYPKKLNFLW